MNRYQEFYNQQRERIGSSNQQNRRNVFNNVRKERRTRMFDLFRGDIATAYEPEEIKPVAKFTFRDTINKLIREKKKKVQKPRPFVVGTVKHKIHSPPFLHEGRRFKEPKKKITTPVLKSFAPSNYKFKIPKGLAVNLDTPSGEENLIGTPFALNTVWNKLDNKSTRRKEAMHTNITCREKKRAYIDPSPNNAFCTANEKSEQKGAKRELWPEAFDEGPIFGRLNMERMSRSLDNLPKDNEEEASDSSQDKVSHPVLPSTENLKLKEDANIEPNNTIMPAETIEKSVLITARMSNEHESEIPTPSEKSTQMDCRLSRISPPKAILSNTIINFDNTKVDIENDNTVSEDINLPCSTPSVQNFFKNIQVQFEKSSDASVMSTPSAIQGAVKECLPGYKDTEIKAATPTSSPVEESLTIHSGSRIEGGTSIIESKKALSDIESPESEQKILNLTFTKSLGLIEEDEGDEEEGEEETVKLNLQYLNKKHKKEDSFPVLLTLNSSNVNKPNIETDNLHEAECDTNSVDNTSQSQNTSFVIEDNKNNEEIPSLLKNNVQDNCVDQTINAIQDKADSPRKSLEKINEVTNTSPKLASHQTDLDKDEILKNSSETPVETISKIDIELNSSKQLDDDQLQAQETEQLIDSLDSTLSNSLTPSKDEQTEVNHIEIERNKNSCGPSNVSSIDTSSHRITEDKDINPGAETHKTTEVDHSEPADGDSNNNSEPCDLSSVSTSNHKVTESKDINSDAETDTNHSEAKDPEQTVATKNSISNNSPVLFEDQVTEAHHNEPASGNNNKNSIQPCNLLSLSTSNRTITENENVNSDVVTDGDYSQAKEYEESVATTNSTSSNDRAPSEEHSTEVNYVKPTNGDDENGNASRTSSLINTSNHRIPEEKNTSLGRIVFSCPPKMIDNIESTDQFITSFDLPEDNIATPSQTEKEMDLVVEVQHLPDSTGSEKIVSKDKSKSRDTSPVFKVKIKITSPSKLETTVAEVTIDAKNAHAGPVQSRDSVSNEPIIDLTDSPISANRKSMKLELRKSALDYKPSPFFLSNQKNNSRLSGSDESDVIDLISDDEDDGPNSLNNLLKKYGLRSGSSSQSPRNRTPLASIGNILRMSTPRTSQSPIISKVNSPAKKTPIFMAETIQRLSRSRTTQSPLVGKVKSSIEKTPVLVTETLPIVHVSPPAAPLEVLHDTPRKTSRRRKALKDITAEIAEAPSPLRVMNLRTRNISVSPSPNKKTPRAVTPCKTPAKYNAVKEVAAEATEDTGHLRVMNLRSRKVHVSPSPKKMTPRRRKNDNQCA